MTTKRVNLLAGTILGGALLLGTAGLVLAQDPTTSPSSSATSGMAGGMMGGGMMGGYGESMRYGACVAHHATTEGGFSSDHNPGMHRGFAGWTGSCAHA